MARNRVTTYSFENGSRTITVTDTKFAGFNKADIRLIVNETQKVVYFSSMQKDNATVSGSNIILSNSFPVLATGDELTIEMDLGFVGSDAVAVEINAGKKLIADAITLKGVPTNETESFSDMAENITDIVGNITVTPLQYPSLNESWHDLAYEVAQFVDSVNPYAFALLISPSVTTFPLLGASAYKVSDGRILTTDQTVTFGANEAGREGKLTKFVIYRRPDPYFAQNYSAYSPAITGRIIGVYNLNMDWSNIGFNGVRIGFAISDSNLKYPIQYGLARIGYTLQASQFLNNGGLGTFIFPDFDPMASDAEKVLVVPNNFMESAVGLTNLGFPKNIKTLMVSGGSAFNNATNLTSLIFPTGLQTLTIIGNSAFANLTNLTSLIFPTGLINLTISGNSAFNNATNLTSLIFPTGLQTLTIIGFGTFQFAFNLTSLIFPTGLVNLTISSGSAFGSCPNLTSIFLSNPSTTLDVSTLTSATAVTRLELENNWNRTVSLTFANLTAVNTKTLMLDKLVDKRFDGTNPSVVTTSTSSPIVTDTNGNGNFLLLFRVGDTITIGAGAVRTIASIESRNQLTLTANAATTGTGQAYNMNKTLTLAAAVKTRLATDYGANWADPYTAKGWTIA